MAGQDVPQRRTERDPAPHPPPGGFRVDARHFLRRFGLVAAIWTTLLAVTAPEVERQTLLWVGLAVLWLWALVSQRVDGPLWLWGWLATGVGAEVFAPIAGTGAWTLTGGVPFVAIAGAALALRKRRLVSVTGLLISAALVRAALSPTLTYGGVLTTILIYAFGALALWWLVHIVVTGECDRERLRAAVAKAEAGRAVAVERAEAAARLHDSTLQSLAAITRAERLDEARGMARDASAALRSWLRGRDLPESSLRRTIERACGTLAEGRDVTVTGAGDHPVDERTRLLVDATIEAVRNAVRHTDGPVRVYVEVDDVAATVWVADRGDGLELHAVPEDRLGVRGSIIGRLDRAGGTARLRSGAEGTEWELRLPLS